MPDTGHSLVKIGKGSSGSFAVVEHRFTATRTQEVREALNL
jgi:hypothetical protein